jgi:hypothetical protein
VEALALIIDPPYEAALDIKVARKWVKELEGLATEGYDVSRYMVKAKKDLEDLILIKERSSNR